MFGNDLATLPNFPAEIRAPQGTLPGVSSFQIHLADHDILTPGDAPDVLVAMNPAALKVNLPDLKRGGTIIVDSHDFTERNLKKVGYDGQPARGRIARRLHPPCRRPHDRHRRLRRGVRPRAQGRRAGEEHVRARPGVVDVRPGHRDHGGIPLAPVRRRPGAARLEHRGAHCRLQLRRDHRGVRRAVRHRAGADGARHLPQHHRQPGAGLRHRRRGRHVRPSGVPRQLPDHAGVGHPARAEQAQEVRRHHVPGRGRDRRHRRRPRCRVRRSDRRHHDVRPRHLAEVARRSAWP